ncbi:heat shock transcription factor, X-linked member 3-like [Rousettus aegyptiacus]|uniref:heat shock transcription factor, X-linked member 3-like n=1 Tax=Rousettus aegyptiacus TaxID=9407 RepID=UPI00168D6DB2|nr:heat shock transcription factor, X-linked member 3-like [Rousettus aegyptiacus]
MTSQDTDMVDKVDEAKLSPLEDEEPATGDPLESSPDGNGESSEVLEIHQDQAINPDLAASQDLASSQDPAVSPDPAVSQDTAASQYPAMSQDPAKSPHSAMSQDPGPHENPQPQNPNGGPDNVEGNSPLLGLPFPRKLWMIVEDDAFTSVTWNDAGDTVVIKEDLFQREVLCRRGADQIFETDSLKSFICLLNLHGFSKIRPRDPSVYYSGNNKIMIYRNSNFQRDKPQLIDNIKRKGHLMITAWPGNNATPKKKKQATPTRRSLRIQLKQRSKEDYPDYDSVMSLYNACYTILLAAVPAMAPIDEPEGEEEEEEEGSSDYKCAFCEHVKDNPDP